MNVIKTPTGIIVVDKASEIIDKETYDSLNDEDKINGTYYVNCDKAKNNSIVADNNSNESINTISVVPDNNAKDIISIGDSSTKKITLNGKVYIGGLSLDEYIKNKINEILNR